ncbi:isochorismatase family protein [Corynebacterium sp. CCM 8864]|uniref:Isochorismatase family protein n=1 Tax=Corynebacterium marambiense TaxID=2765364 RepID=A0ABS0VUG1_9CORY|nr:isochorismatase family protein [Corynebacterium marambiense]
MTEPRPSETCLVIVDVQAGFISEYTKRCLPWIHELVKDPRFAFKIATRFANAPGSLFRTRIGWNRLSTPEEIALDSVVESNVDAVVDKETYGCAEEIDDLLKARGIGQVLLVGIDTDVCVLQNAAQLFDRGYPVWVDMRGCATGGGYQADNAAVPLLRRTIGGDQVIGCTVDGARGQDPR